MESTPVIDTIWNLMFRCQHRRTTFPLTPARSKKGANSSDKHAETYVVCLDCGKQFIYDWEKMRLAGAVDISDQASAAEDSSRKVPFRTKSKMRYLLWGSALSAAVVLGKTARSRKKSRSAAKKDGEGDQHKDAQTPGST